MPAPDAVAVRVRATVCRRNLVDGVLRRALTRAVPMTVRRSAGGTPATGFGGGVPAHSLSRQRCQKLGVEGGRSVPLPDRSVQHCVAWLTCPNVRLDRLAHVP